MSLSSLRGRLARGVLTFLAASALIVLMCLLFLRSGPDESLNMVIGNPEALREETRAEPRMSTPLQPVLDPDAEFEERVKDRNRWREQLLTSLPKEPQERSISRVSLTGKVVAAGSGAAVANAIVAVESTIDIEHGNRVVLSGFEGADPSSDRRYRPVRSSEDGSFKLSGRVDSSYLDKTMIEVAAFALDCGDFGLGYGRRSLVLKEANEPVVIEVSGSVALSGLVSDEHSAGVGGIRVEITARSGKGPDWKPKTPLDQAMFLGAWAAPQRFFASTVTDEKGGFRFSGLSPGTYAVLVNNNQKGFVFQRSGGNLMSEEFSGYAPFWAGGALKEDGSSFVEFTAVKEPTQLVRVRDKAGKPIEGAYCDMEMIYTPGAWHETAIASTSDGEGMARLALKGNRTKDGDPYRLVVAARGFEYVTRDIPFSRNETVDVVLDKAGSVLKGRVIDNSGRPLAGARIRLCGVSEQGRRLVDGVVLSEVLSDEKGSFFFDVLRPGSKHVVSVHHPDYRRFEEGVRVWGRQYQAGEDIEVVMAPKPKSED